MTKKAPMLFLCWLALFGANAARAQPDGDVSAMLERVLPAVVTVAVEKEVAANQPYGFSGNAVAEAYLRTLDLSGAASSGSGFVVRHEGRPYVITNAHVIEQAAGDEAIFVYAIDQTRYPIRIVGADSFYDIAVLALPNEVPDGKIGSLQFKAAPPRLGDRVFAVGNPLRNYPYSVSDGIVSGLNRVLGGLTGKFGYLQSTATTIWGNSGGPLVDTAGQVVGINTSIEIFRGNKQNYIQPQINFALEGGLASQLVTDILTNNGRVRRAFLGLEVTQYHPLKDNGNQARSESPILTGVLPGSPAARALAEQMGQRIVAVDGVPTRNLEEVQGALEAVRPGGAATLTLETSRGQRADYTVASEELPRERLADLARYFFEQKGLGRAVEENGRVLVRLAPNPPSAQPGQESSRSESDAVMDLAFDRQLRQFLQAMIAPPPRARSLAVAGAGIAQMEFWRVGSLADLGLAIRLAARTGWIDLIPENGNGESLVRVSIPSRTGTLARTLFY